MADAAPSTAASAPARAFWTAACPDASHATVPLGVNLEGLADWMRTPMYVDAMKTARAFGPAAQPWGTPVPTGRDGWPTGDFGSCVITDMPHMAGAYQFSCTGRLRAIVPVATRAVVTGFAYHAATDTTTATVTVPPGETQLYLGFTGTQPGGIKNVRLLRPGYSPGTRQVFTNEFLASLRPFSTLRLMDFLATNGNPVHHWSERNTLDVATYTNGKGGPWEDAIQLANLTGKDLWINVPARADDDYVLQLARLFKSRLAPERKIYIEYSNEVWNWGFAQSHQNIDLAKAEVAAGDTKLSASIGPDDQPANDAYLGWKRVAKRLIEISNIFQRVYGRQALFQTIRPVLASQIGWDEPLLIQTEFIEREYGAPNRYLYAIAGAPYFGIGSDATGKPLGGRTDLTTDDVLGAMRRSIEQYRAGGLWPYAMIARRYGVRYFAYEAGPDIGQGDQSLQARLDASRDPRMAQLIQGYLDAWYQCGGGLCLYFSHVGGYSKWGAWGITDDILKPSPKSLGIEAVLSARRPTPDAGIAVPGEITSQDLAVDTWGNVHNPLSTGSGPLGTINPGQRLDFLIDVRSAGRYIVTADSISSDPTVSLMVQIDNCPPIKIPFTMSTQNKLIDLPKGPSSLRLIITGGSATLRDIRLAPAAAR